jgi:hypothetical protein
MKNIDINNFNISMIILPKKPGRLLRIGTEDPCINVILTTENKLHLEYNYESEISENPINIYENVNFIKRDNKVTVQFRDQEIFLILDRNNYSSIDKLIMFGGFDYVGCISSIRINRQPVSTYEAVYDKIEKKAYCD